jgi:hypothetical protein
VAKVRRGFGIKNHSPASGDINGKVGERHRSRHGRGSKKTAGYEDSWRDKMYGAKICYSRGNEQRRGGMRGLVDKGKGVCHTERGARASDEIWDRT